MAHGRAQRHGDLQRAQPIFEHLSRGDEARRDAQLGVAPLELAQQHPGHALKDPCQLQLGQQAVQAVGALADLLQQQDRPLELRCPGRPQQVAEQAEVAAENAAKQKELDDRQAKMDAEDAERQAVRDAEDKARLARDFARNAEIKAEQDRVAEEQAAAQKVIDDENKRIADEQTALANETYRRAAEAEAERIAAEQAPDREKLFFFANLVDSLIGAKPELTTDTAKEILQQANAMLIEVAYDIRKSTEEMK